MKKRERKSLYHQINQHHRMLLPSQGSEMIAAVMAKW